MYTHSSIAKQNLLRLLKSCQNKWTSVLHNVHFKLIQELPLS